MVVRGPCGPDWIIWACIRQSAVSRPICCCEAPGFDQSSDAELIRGPWPRTPDEFGVRRLVETRRLAATDRPRHRGLPDAGPDDPVRAAGAAHDHPAGRLPPLHDRSRLLVGAWQVIERRVRS